MLSNVRVVDLSRILAGPFCSMMLGDYGADVIKVESHTGDDTRTWGPPFVDDDAIYFWSVNRNKKSVVIDFKTSQGSELIREMTKKSDIFIENFIPGKLKKYGLDYESLKAINPGLVYCSITGYGQTGPLSQNGGYDLIAAAMGGLLHITGPEDGEPCRVGVAITDILTGMMSCNSILAALHQRTHIPDKSGCHIDCNLLSTQIAMLFHIGANYLTKGIESKRIGTSHSALVPYQAFRTSDNRYFVVCAGNDKQFKHFCDIISRSELVHDSKFRTNPDRVTNRNDLVKVIKCRFEELTLKEWIDKFAGSGLAHGPINDLKDTFNNPQVKHLSDQLIASWKSTRGSISVPGNPVFIRTRDNSFQYKIPQYMEPPKLAEHTEQVLKTLLGLNSETIESFKRSNIIKCL